MTTAADFSKIRRQHLNANAERIPNDGFHFPLLRDIGKHKVAPCLHYWVFGQSIQGIARLLMAITRPIGKSEIDRYEEVLNGHNK